MKILLTLKRIFKRAMPGEFGDFWFQNIAARVWAGTNVNEETALQMSAVYACIRILSDTIGYLPLRLYRRLPDDGRERVTGTRGTELFKYAPNAEMSAFRFKQLFMGHLTAWGNSYHFVSRDAANRVVEIWPLRPDRMTVRRKRPAGELEYIYRGNSGGQVTLSPREVWHIPGFGYDGVMGYSVIQLARQGIGLGLAAEEFSARFFGQGTHMGVVVKTQKKMGAEAHKKLENSMAKGYSGLGKTHKLMVLEEGMDIEKLGIHPEDAALVAQRQFQIQDICRFYRVPLHLVQDETRSTFNNIAEQGINFARHTITPWAALIEGEMNRYFLTPAQRRTMYWEFDLNGLMRGDFKARMEGYVQAVSNGIMTRNEARKLENLNAMKGKGGDILTVQLAMTDLELIADPPEPQPLVVPQLPEGGEGDPDPDELENKSWAMRLLLEHKEDRVTKDDWVDAYKDGIPHWALDLAPSLFAQEFLESIKADGTEGDLLEIGCGNGRDSIFFALAGLDVTAIDLVPAAVDLAKENAEKAKVKIHFKVADGEDLPYDSSTFDAVFSLSVLHSTDLNKSIPEISRVLRGDSLAFVYIYGNTQKADGTEEEHIKVDDFIELLKVNEFEVLDFYTTDEDEFDDVGEKHKILVAYLKRN